MKKLILAIALLSLALMSCTTSLEGRVVAEQQVPVCGVLPLSGEWAIFGQEVSRGMELAVQEFGSDQFKLVLEDDRYEPRYTVTATRKMISEDRCPAIFPLFIETANPIVPILEQEKVPGIVLIDRTESVSEHEYLFSVGYSTERTGAKIADFAFDKKHARTAVVIQDPVEWSIIIGDAFADRFEERGGEVIEKMMLAPGENFQTIVSKLESLRPDVVHFSTPLNDQELFVRRVKERGLDVLLLGGDAYSDDLIDAAGAAAEGTCKTDVPRRDSEEFDALMVKYEARYGGAAAIPSFVALGYDAVMVYAEAIESAESLDGPDLREALLAVDNYQSPLGETLSLADGGGAWRVESIYCVEDGELVLMEE